MSMLYDLKLRLTYVYENPVFGGRHLVRVMPRRNEPGQRVVASSLAFDPEPLERTEGIDFFGNATTAIVEGDPHERLEIAMTARIQVDRMEPDTERSAPVWRLPGDLASTRSLDAQSPHHFLAASPAIDLHDEITAYAGDIARRCATVGELADALCRAIDRDFRYDPKATTVSTTTGEAFRLRRGVCQDFSHVMISGLRGLGVPAAYVSGFLRTIPPPGRERLEGADAMHAWVSVWCGHEAGWLDFDPTNAMPAGNDHIVAARGRDYSDVSPIVGILRSAGGQKAKQAVDVIPVES